MIEILKNRFSLCLFALALFASSAAQALPTYRVSVDTSGHAGRALMDFTFLANAGATPVTAILTNFSGAFAESFDRSPGVTGDIPGQVVLSNQDGGDYLTQFVNLGDWFSFDVRFEGDFAGTENIDGSQFNATLYNEDLTGYIGGEGSFVEFALLPQVNGVPGGVQVATPAGLADVSEIPEPSSLLLALGAIALLGFGRGRPGRGAIRAQRFAMS